MLATSTNVPFPGHNHLLTTGTDDPSLELLLNYIYISFTFTFWFKHILFHHTLKMD